MNAPVRHRLLAPLAPRLIDEDMAAAYLGLGKTTFREKWKQGVLPQPIRMGRRLLWDVILLDRYVDVLSGIRAASGSWDDL